MTTINHSGQYKTDDGYVIPPLKWAGGKRWITARFPQLFPRQFDKYFEPFLGGGAVFFSLRPGCAVLGDTNKELVNMYNCIKDDWSKVESFLSEHHFKHCKEYYYYVRKMDFSDNVERAASFIYLNRTCWNGLYRVNLKGKFNVPMGTKDWVIAPEDNFKAISDLLANSMIKHQDFENTVSSARSGDFVFFDPPYTVKHNLNGFIKYNEHLFTWKDQVRLRDCAVDLARRGARVLITNADHTSVRDLYAGEGEIEHVSRYSGLSGKIHGRAPTTELVVRLGPWE